MLIWEGVLSVLERLFIVVRWFKRFFVSKGLIAFVAVSIFTRIYRAFFYGFGKLRNSRERVESVARFKAAVIFIGQLIGIMVAIG